MNENIDSTQTNLIVTATPIEGQNYVHLQWTDLGKGYTYTVYSKGESEEVYQSIPSKTNIKVLNIYPNTGNNLKTWMENNGYGKGLIFVDEVNIDKFNANPSSYLKDANGNWNYDVIYEGAWDMNNSKDLSSQGLEAIKEFIESGRGYLSGHDTFFLRNDFTATNRNKLISYFNIQLSAYDNLYNIGSTAITIKKKGLLINYPWVIGDVGGTLTVPMSHTSTQFASGDVWMNYSNNQWSSAKEISSYGGKNATNNFYLTTWNNCAMIQTGHSNGAATQDEQKLLANTLFYLAQLTSNTSCDDHKGQDVTGPDKVTITSVSSDDKNLNVVYSKPNDKGTSYEYYVKASDGNAANDIISNTVSAVNTSGIAGYSYVIDNIENTEPDNKIDTSDLSISVPLSGLDLLKPIYIHIKAIDNAGNVSETTHYEYKYVNSLTLDKTEITILEGREEQITATTNPVGIGVTWTSSDTSIATVDETGKITGIKPGQVTITAATIWGGLSETCAVTVKRDIILDIEPKKDKIHIKENVIANLVIENITEIAAEDALIKYDSTKLKFIGANEVEGIKLVKLDQDDNELRIITASEGLEGIANAKRVLLKLYFQGIASGEALVDIIKGKVSDGIQMEKDLTYDECGEATITIDDILIPDDVNRSGEFTLLDLAIDARHLGEDPNSLPQYVTDQVINGVIDNDDLLKIGEYMLNNPNYKLK
ncbi:Ig-like domain-containing protein [Clostridium saccharoperbutylacetonicum]